MLLSTLCVQLIKLQQELPSRDSEACTPMAANRHGQDTLPECFHFRSYVKAQR